jgi:DNA invertase Pin-like site-specific DNA recombinase
MHPKITPEHLGRGAVVYIRQSTMGQVAEHTESQRRQYALADSARTYGFASVTVIDDDLGRSGSGLVERPGFQKLVASVCSGSAGAVFCIEASRLARNGRDWHHLIDLCALVGTLVIDPDGTYDPRLVNDRLLLGLKGTMSEYELSLLRQRGIAARDSKALRGELQFLLPPGYCWNEIGQIEMDPDERVRGTIRLLFDKFQELGSARQVLLWAQDQALQLPITRRNNSSVCKIEWRAAAYHTVLQILRHPVYAGAYVFGRTTQRTRIADGRARKTSGHSKPMTAWNVLLRDHHPGYISWDQYEANQKLISENAHMQRRTERKSARGGRALLTGLVRCGRCGRTMRVFYGTQSGHAHRYHCRGDDSHVGGWLCIGIGGVRIDRAVAAQIVEAVSEHAIEAAIQAADQSVRADNEIRQALCRELEEARYEASLAARRYEVVDPTKRLVARELETRWNTALERVAHLEDRIARHDVAAALRPKVDRAALMALARDLPTTWNAPGTDARTKQRITHILIREVVLDRDDATNEALVTIHWNGGRHTELRVSRVRTGRYPADSYPNPVESSASSAASCRIVASWP